MKDSKLLGENNAFKIYLSTQEAEATVLSKLAIMLLLLLLVFLLRVWVSCFALIL